VEALTDIAGKTGRFAGSPAESAAVAYVEEQLKAAGCRTRRLPFNCNVWEPGETEVVLLDPDRILDAIALPYSGMTAAEGEEFEVVDGGYGTADEIAAIEGLPSGRAILVSDDDPPGTVVHRRQKYRNVVGAGGGAFLCAPGTPDGDKQPGYVGPGNGAPAKIPGIALSSGSAYYLRRALEEGPVTVRILSRPKVRAGQLDNISGMLCRDPEPGVHVGICAHLDTHPGSQGALDNASGVALMLTLMEVLAPYVPLFRCDVQAFGFAAEEAGGIGSHRFHDDHPDVWAGMSAMMNLDVPSGPGRDVLRVTDTRLGRRLSHAISGIGVPVPVQVGRFRGSDHAPFAESGVPCVWKTTDAHNVDADRSPVPGTLDTIDAVDWLALKQSGCIAAVALLELLLDSESAAFGNGDEG
jgi:aminopeptidase YwaD